jgi:hypothetical protein
VWRLQFKVQGIGFRILGVKVQGLVVCVFGF